MFKLEPRMRTQVGKGAGQQVQRVQTGWTGRQAVRVRVLRHSCIIGLQNLLGPSCRCCGDMGQSLGLLGLGQGASHAITKTLTEIDDATVLKFWSMQLLERMPALDEAEYLRNLGAEVKEGVPSTAAASVAAGPGAAPSAAGAAGDLLGDLGECCVWGSYCSRSPGVACVLELG